MTSSTPLPATPSGRGRPKGSSSLKSKKSKATTFATDADKKSQAFDTPSTVIDSHAVQNVIHTVDEQVRENFSNIIKI